MRTCAQCGLSIGETATFCAVCGAQGEALSGARSAEARAAWETNDGVAETSPFVFAAPEPVAPAASEPVAVAPEAPVPAPVAVAPPPPPPAPPAGVSDVTTDAASAPAAGDAAPAPAGGDADPQSRLVEISRTLRDADRCERDDAPRAAEIYRTAIIAYLEATDDPLASEEARRGLLRSFDRLSRVLQRAGLAAEALEQIEMADALGLLDSADERTEGYREALRKRRKSLQESDEVAAASSF